MESEVQTTDVLRKFWNVKTFVLITGASRGIGRTIALHLSRIVGSGSLFLLSSRDEQKLTSLKDEINNINPDIRVHSVKFDFSRPDGEAFTQMMRDSLAAFDVTAGSFSHAICFHNAGSLGDVSKKASEHSSVSEVTEYFQLNLVSVIVLTSKFLDLFGTTARRTVVNISSLCAVQPMTCLSLYCTGKAARDMFFRVLALEEPEVRVLNYAPGPVDTDMLSTLASDSWSPESCQQTQTMKEQGIALKPETTVAKLASILALDRFNSGDHVDYYDNIPK